MKVALVFPRFKYSSGDPPMGLLYIASHLRENTKCDVKLIDTTFMKDPLSKVSEILDKETFDVVGISVMTTMITAGYTVAKLVKQKNPDAKIIFGGPHATVMPTETLDNEHVDAVCIGEGEETMLELIKKNGKFDKIAGIWFKKKGKIIKNKPRAPINDLDKLEFPARDLLPKEYFDYKEWVQLDSVSLNLKGMNVLTSRGCPYNCSYCQPTLRKIFGKITRQRSADNVVAELVQLKEKYGINAVMFLDDTFTFNEKWILEFCDRVIEKKLKLILGGNSRANLVTDKVFRKLKEAGLRKVFLGIEAGSQRVLDIVYQKGITLAQVRSATNILKSLGLKIQGYFMLGAPTETEEEINRTIKFANELPIDEATFSITTPLPHTHLYEKTKEEIKVPLCDLDYYKVSLYGPEKQKRLTMLKRKAFLRFYLAPKRLPFTILNLLRFDKLASKLKRF